jgi:hypothetical protein
MPPSRPRNSSVQDKGFYKFVLLLLGGPVVIVIVAINTGYFLGSMFIGTAALVLILTIGSDMSVRLVSYISALILVGLGLPFIIPWDKSSGPGLTNDDRYRKLLGESAYSCQAGHYDEQNCRAQKQGLDDVAKWLNEQKR